MQGAQKLSCAELLHRHLVHPTVCCTINMVSVAGAASCNCAQAASDDIQMPGPTPASRASLQVPLVIRGPGGVGRQLGAEHSQRLESYFQSIPGVQLVACSTAANAKALLKSAIRSDNPIIFFEHVLLYNVKGELVGTPDCWGRCDDRCKRALPPIGREPSWKATWNEELCRLWCCRTLL
jgi:Transketolase, pyrimidine binding domain